VTIIFVFNGKLLIPCVQCPYEETNDCIKSVCTYKISQQSYALLQALTGDSLHVHMPQCNVQCDCKSVNKNSLFKI